jgi:hypothetical protein
LATRSTNQRQFKAALGSCVAALRRLAEYKLEKPIQRRLTELSENKEFLTRKEQIELRGLVTFWQKRTREKLEAQLALKLLGEVAPNLVAPK